MSDRPASTTFNTVTNTKLLEGLRQAGNRTVWQSFVERYRPMIERYAGRLGLRDADAQDAAQQTLITFCDAYQQGKYDRGRGRLREWLFGIARNQIRNAMKRRAKQEVQVAEEGGQTDFFARLPDDNEMEQLWDRQWREAVLRQCLAEVRREFDAKSLAAFELFAWQGWTAQQVAEHLNMTANAVFIVKHRVMKRIGALVPQMEDVW